jgi:hypothetical protein
MMAKRAHHLLSYIGFQQHRAWQNHVLITRMITRATVHRDGRDVVHQMRHERQIYHATNHARCTKTRKAGQSRRPIEVKQGEPYTPQTCGVQRLPSKALEKHPVHAYGGSITARHGRKGAWM